MQITKQNRHLPVVAACMVGTVLSVTPVITMTFGLFLIPVSRDFHWTRAAVSGGLLILCLVTAASYAMAGRLADRYGARRLVVPGALMLALAIAALSLSNGNIFLFYLMFALIGLAGSLPSTMMFSRVISGWFDERRGLMLGVTAGIGNGVGASLMPFVAMLLMRHFGWRGAYLGLGCCVAVFSFPVLLLLLREEGYGRRIVEQPAARSGLSFVEAVATPVFWVILVAVALGAGCMTAIISHIVPMLSGRAVPLAVSVSIMSTLSATCALWQIAMGWLMDRSRSPRIMAPFYCAALVGLPLLQSGSLPVLIAGGVLIGIGMGAEYGALPYVISRYFGLRAYGAIAGVMYAAVIVAQGMTPLLMDISYGRTGSYAISIYAMGAALAVGTLLLALLKPYANGPLGLKAAGLPLAVSRNTQARVMPAGLGS